MEKRPLSPTDPDKVADALYGTGVDLKEEELLLRDQPTFSSYYSHTQLAPMAIKSQILGYAAARLAQQGMAPGTAVGDYLTAAVEEMLVPILREMVAVLRHRRRPIRKEGKLEVARALREIAARQKEAETKRSQKKVDLGLSEGEAPKAEELSHRAANQTAAMMTAGRLKTYSWMQGGGGRVARGDDVRYREARQEDLFSVRDLVAVLEGRRRGVERTLVKGYSKLKDVYR